MTLMFIAIVLFAACLAWAMMPDAGVAAIRKRVLGNVATEERPTVLGQLVELLAPINRYLPTGWYSVHIWRLLQAAGLRTPAIHFFVLQEIAGITGFFLYFMVTFSVV